MTEPCFPNQSRRSESTRTPQGCSSSPAHRPEAIGRYQILSTISAGGQATVFRARDPLLRRDVAVKLSHTRVADHERAASRIHQEGALLARIDHPALARIYDSGLHGAFPYLVMELIPGQTLREFCRRKTPSVQEIQSLMEQLAAGLRAAHAQRVLHLDLKPDNVMMTADGTCKLIDFGLGWLHTQAEFRAVPIVAGTPGFMAPEQQQADSCTFSPATDIFGLGRILKYLLERQVIDGQNRRPRWPGQLSAVLSLHRRRLGRVCRQATAPDPRNRFHSVETFIQRLRRCPVSRRRCQAVALMVAGGLLQAHGLTTASYDSPAPHAAMQPDASAQAAPIRVSLKLRVQTSRPESPCVAIWSPTLGWKPLSHLVALESPNQTHLWRPRTRGDTLQMELDAPIFAIVAWDGSASEQSLDWEPRQGLSDDARQRESLRIWSFGTASPLGERSGQDPIDAWAHSLQGALRSLDAPFQAQLVRIPRNEKSTRELSLTVRIP